MRIYSGRRGFDLPLLDYAWLIQLINKEKGQYRAHSSVHITELGAHMRPHYQGRYHSTFLILSDQNEVKLCGH
jgi:hypothetical protein